MRRLHFVLILFVFVAALIFRSGFAAADPIPLKMWTFLSSQTSDPRSAALLSIMDDFNKSQSEYRVQMQSIDFGRIDNMVIQATAANQGPDIVNVYSDLLSMHVAAKTLTPLDKYIASMSEAEKTDFIVPLRFMTFKGQIMALPWESRVWLYWYRSDLLDKAGAKVPKTLDELGSVSGAITTDSVMGFALGASEGQLGAFRCCGAPAATWSMARVMLSSTATPA